MKLKLAITDTYKQLAEDISLLVKNYPTVEFEYFNEEIFKERKKAFALKNEWGTRMAPFAVLVDNEKNPIYAFYSERQECTLEKIKSILNSYIVY